MHPRRNEGVSLEEIERNGELHYYITGPFGDRFELSRSLYDVLLFDDEYKPLDLSLEDERTLLLLRDNKLISTSRLVKDDGLTDRFILASFEKRKQPRSVLFKIANVLMAVLAVALPIAWAYTFATSPLEIDPYINWWLCLVALIVGLVIHEAGHALAALAAGYKITEIGLRIFGFIPVNCYVGVSFDADSPKVGALQFSLAGAEVNLIVACICSIIAMNNYSLSATMDVFAFINFAIAFLSLLPIMGADGESALSLLCGVNNINDEFKKLFHDKSYRRELFHSGFKAIRRLLGFVIISISYVVYGMIIVGLIGEAVSAIVWLLQN